MPKEQESYTIPLKPNRLNRTSSEKPLSVIEKTTKPVIARFTKTILSRVEKKMMNPMKPEFQEGFEEKFLGIMENSNVMPVVYSNHFDHANGLEMAVISKTLTDLINTKRNSENQFNGFTMVIASSLENGFQKLFLQEAVTQIEENYLPEFKLSVARCVSKNDRIRRGINFSNIAFFRQIDRMAKNGNEGLAIFPEGTVESGRYEGEGKERHVKGMQKFDSEGLDKIISRALVKDSHKEVVYIPMAIAGKNRVHTDHRVPTLISLKTLFWTRHPKSLVSIKVGMPILHSELLQKIRQEKRREATSDDISNHLGKIVAELLPSDQPHLKGVYR